MLPLQDSAKGSGHLQITFVKQSISNWEQQFKTTIQLDNNLENFEIPFSEFTSAAGEELILDDIVTIVFTMKTSNGGMETLEMQLKDISFAQTDTLSITNLEGQDELQLRAIPNPMSINTTLIFNASVNEDVQIVVYDQLGKVVRSSFYKAVVGRNAFDLQRQNLSAGLYFCQIQGTTRNSKTIKLLVK